MRDYLKLEEIEEILKEWGLDEAIMPSMNNAAEVCLCYAKERSECCCGAWDDVEYLEVDNGHPDEELAKWEYLGLPPI